MPFTLAHPAAVVFLKSKYFSMSGLILGAMSPDFIYFILFGPSSNEGHTLRGLILINIPICILLNYLYFKFIKNYLIINLPNSISKYYSYLINWKWENNNFKSLIIFIYSVILGWITHVLWDSFTHKGGYFVNKIEFLNRILEINNYKIPFYKIAQHGSTLIGILLILIYLYKLRFKGELIEISIVSKLKYYLLIISTTLITISLSYLYFNTIYKFTIGNLVVSLVNGIFLGYIFAGIYFSNKKCVNKRDIV
ncbi:DUF4184 family protein [Clostridium carnis]